jgi:prolipoprotein diacylglyceryltransferase
MTIAGAILLIVVGAILTFATNIHVQGVNLDIVGWILMIAGAAGLILSFFQDAIWGERVRRRQLAEEERREAAEVPPRVPPRY